ncbi:MAG TPA: GYD domain-containing protein [Xanthobacteraceae bacterium]|nr:GYD domain-containing protein [Xanthobacteraceae bacterium]
MPKYLVEARYTTQGAKGLAREGGSGRRAAIAKTVESAGGKLETVYFAFGDVDVYIIVDLPDNVSAAAASLAANQTGFLASKTIVLLTAEEMDQATKRKIDFRPPGQ